MRGQLEGGIVDGLGVSAIVPRERRKWELRRWRSVAWCSCPVPKILEQIVKVVAFSELQVLNSLIDKVVDSPVRNRDRPFCAGKHLRFCYSTE